MQQLLDEANTIKNTWLNPDGTAKVFDEAIQAKYGNGAATQRELDADRLHNIERYELPVLQAADAVESNTAEVQAAIAKGAKIRGNAWKNVGLTDEENKMINYLYGTLDRQAAEDAAKIGIVDYAKVRDSQSSGERIAKFMEIGENDNLATRIKKRADAAVGSMATGYAGSVIQGLNTSLNYIKGVLTDNDYVTQENLGSKLLDASAALREVSTKGLDPVSAFVLESAESAGESAPGMLVNLVSGVLAKAATFAQSQGKQSYAMKRAGNTNGNKQFFDSGAIAAIETLSEMLPMETFADIVNDKTIKAMGSGKALSFIGNVAKQIFGEGFEEGISYLATTLYDIMMNRENSEYGKYRQGLIDDGATDAEATKLTNAKFFVKDLALNIGGGSIGGVIMGSFGDVLGNIFSGDVKKYTRLDADTRQNLQTALEPYDVGNGKFVRVVTNANGDTVSVEAFDRMSDIPDWVEAAEDNAQSQANYQRTESTGNLREGDGNQYTVFRIDRNKNGDIKKARVLDSSTQRSENGIGNLFDAARQVLTGNAMTAEGRVEAEQRLRESVRAARQEMMADTIGQDTMDTLTDFAEMVAEMDTDEVQRLSDALNRIGEGKFLDDVMAYTNQEAANYTTVNKDISALRNSVNALYDSLGMERTNHNIYRVTDAQGRVVRAWGKAATAEIEAQDKDAEYSDISTLDHELTALFDKLGISRKSDPSLGRQAVPGYREYVGESAEDKRARRAAAASKIAAEDPNYREYNPNVMVGYATVEELNAPKALVDTSDPRRRLAKLLEQRFEQLKEDVQKGTSVKQTALQELKNAIDLLASGDSFSMESANRHSNQKENVIYADERVGMRNLPVLRYDPRERMARLVNARLQQLESNIHNVTPRDVKQLQDIVQRIATNDTMANGEIYVEDAVDTDLLIDAYGLRGIYDAMPAEQQRQLQQIMQQLEQQGREKAATAETPKNAPRTKGEAKATNVKANTTETATNERATDSKATESKPVIVSRKVTPATRLTMQNASKQKQVAVRSAQQLAGRLGLKLEWADRIEVTLRDGARAESNGFFDPATKTLTLRYNPQSGTDVLRIAGHEITHALEQTNQYASLRAAATTLLKRDGKYEALYDEIADTYGTEDKAYIEQEMVSRFVEDYIFTDAQVVQDIIANNSGLGARIRNMIHRLFSRSKGISGAEGTLRNAMEIWDKAYREAAKKPKQAKSVEGKASVFRNIPSKTTDKKNTRRHYDTVIGAQVMDADQKQQVALLADADGYVPVSNEDDLNAVRKDIDNGGYEKAVHRFDAAFDMFTDVGVKQMHRSIALGETLLVDAAKRGDNAAVEAIVGKLAAMGTVAGQTLQAFSMIKKLSPAGKLAALDAQLAMLNKKLKARHRGAKPFVPVGISEDWRNAYLEATTKEQQDAVMDNIVEHCAAQIESSAADKVQAWRYMSMLFNIKTNTRNLASNVAMLGLASAKDLVGVLGERSAVGMGKMQQADRTKAVLNPRSARDRALTAFAKDYFNNVTGEAVANGGKVGFTGSVMAKARVFNNRVLEGARKLSSEALEGADKMFLGARYTSTFAQAAKARGYTAEFLESGTPEAVKALHDLDAYATREAQKATFRDANALATYMSKVEDINWFSKIAVGGTVPFKKTPMNVLKRGLEYSPAGVVRGLYEMLSIANTNRGNKKYGTDNQAKYTAAQVVDSMASGLTGTAAMALGWFLASMGWVRAGGDDDKRKNNYETYTLNEQDYALVIGNARITIDWISPAAMPLFMGVAVADMMGAGSDGAGFTMDKFLRTIGNLTQPVFEQSFLSGLTTTLKSAGQSEQFVMDMALSVAESYLGQFIPTAANQLARAVDPYRRNASYVSEDSRIRPLEKFAQKTINRIPFASMQLQKSVDAWGRDERITGGNAFGRFLLAGISPANVSFVEPTAVDNEVVRLAQQSGTSSALPDNYHSKTTIDYKKNDEMVTETFQLSAEDKKAYDTAYGKAAYDALDDMITSQAYKRMNDTERLKAVQAAYEYAKDVADYEYARKHRLDMEMPDSIDTAAKGGSVGLEAGSILAIKKKLGTFNAKDEQGESVNGLKKKRQREYINGLTLTAAQKQFLLEEFVDKKDEKEDETKKKTTVKRTGRTLQ